jgi:hypothetical protein
MGTHLDRMSARGTYVYCVVESTARPALRRRLKGLPGTSAVRLVSLGRRQWLAVADAPLAEYGEAAINQRLSDLDWVSRAAIAHERIVEGFLTARAVVPMKLFTLFTSDERAVASIRRRQRQINGAIRRVRGRTEWGLRVSLDRARTGSPEPGLAPGASPGALYLARKKAQYDATAQMAAKARGVADDLYERAARIAAVARRRPSTELPVEGGPLLLAAALLVPRTRTARLRQTMAREARRLAPQGFQVALTGPWPPYSFIQD